METAFLVVVVAAVVVGAVWAVARLLVDVTVEVSTRTAEAIRGPAALAQPMALPLEQPPPGEAMFPPWEEEPWSLETDPAPPVD